jgi:hypothetical protein
VSCASLTNTAPFPLIVPGWHRSQYGAGTPTASHQLIVDAHALFATLPITTGIHLVYSSVRAKAFASVIWMRLVDAHAHADLRRVRVRTCVEGVVDDVMLAAEPNLTYTFVWQRRNVYSQKVYGLTTANVRIEYYYASCTRAVVVQRTVDIDGHRTAGDTDFGGWSLNVHHHLNVIAGEWLGIVYTRRTCAGVIERGDGRTVYMHTLPPMVSTHLGRAVQRPAACTMCAVGQLLPSSVVTLYQPLAVAASADGSLYIGDYNLVRRQIPDGGNVVTVLELRCVGNHFIN